jgi:transcription elongation factor GreA
LEHEFKRGRIINAVYHAGTKRCGHGRTHAADCYGHKVTVFDVQEKEIITLVLTNPRDSNPDKGFISCFSPLGRQLIGRRPGDVIDIKIFGRTAIFRVIRIEH